MKFVSMFKKVASVTLALVLIALAEFGSPLTTQAAPFGGQAGLVVPCYNSAIYAALGAPRGGPFIWTPSTRTYQFGPPRYAGQWLLGLSGIPYFCVVSIEPVIVWSGISIYMMGSSGGASGRGGSGGSIYSPGPVSPTPPSGPSGGGTGGGGTGGGGLSNRVFVSEIFASVDSMHGKSADNQWVELYNGSSQQTDVSGWTLRSGTATTTLPSGISLTPGQFMIITMATSTRNFWSIPDTTRIVVLGSPITGGLSPAGDMLVLRDAQYNPIDSVSWGTNKTVFDPSATVVSPGHSLARQSLANVTGTVSDWIDLLTPTPGR